MSSTAQPVSQITLNGAPHPLRGRRVLDLVEELALDPKAVAIEQNRRIVPRSAYAETPLMDGDQVEIVSFIGGG